MEAHVSQPLLTIAIPTYNRSDCLQLCLSTLIPQVLAVEGEVELLISDNASTDGTKNLVEGQQAAGVSLTYFRNDTNLGADRNFVQCFQRARGKYLQLLGDDDVLLEGALERILGVLRSHEAGVVHLKGYGFRDDYRKEHPRRPGSGEVLVYRDPREFAAKVNINLTFISGNVVNRTMVLDLAQWEACLDTNLFQLGWIVPAALAAPVNVVIDEDLWPRRPRTPGATACAGSSD